LVPHVPAMYRVNRITSSAGRKRDFFYGMFKATAFPHLKSTLVCILTGAKTVYSPMERPNLKRVSPTTRKVIRTKG
jgi:hypothetical protein